MDFQDDDVVIKFIAYSKERYESLKEGKIKLANNIFDKLYRNIAVTIRNYPDHGEAILSYLVTHESPEVRSNAAYLLIPINEKKALLVLKELAGSKLPWLASSSRITMEEWKKGALDVDWFMKQN